MAGQQQTQNPPKTLPANFFDQGEGAGSASGSVSTTPPKTLPPNFFASPEAQQPGPESQSTLPIPDANATIAKPKINMQTEPLPAPVRAYQGVSETFGTLPQDIEGMAKQAHEAGSAVAEGLQGVGDQIAGVDSPAARELQQSKISNIANSIPTTIRAAYRSIVPAQDPNDPNAGYVKQGAGIIGNLGKLALAKTLGPESESASTGDSLVKRTQMLNAAINASGNKLNFPQLWKTVLPDVDQTIINNRSLKPSGLRGLYDALDRTGAKLEAEYEQDALQRYRHVPVPDAGFNIVGWIMDQITPEMERNEPELAEKLRDEAARYDHVHTAGDLNDLRERLNAEEKAFFNKKAPAQTADLLYRAKTMANVAADNAVRDSLYDFLQNKTGQDYRPLKEVQGAIKDLKSHIADRTTGLENAASNAAGRPLFSRSGAHMYLSAGGRPHAYLGRVLDMFRPEAVRELNMADKNVAKAFNTLDSRGAVGTQPRSNVRGLLPSGGYDLGPSSYTGEPSSPPPISPGENEINAPTSTRATRFGRLLSEAGNEIRNEHGQIPLRASIEPLGEPSAPPPTLDFRPSLLNPRAGKFVGPSEIRPVENPTPALLPPESHSLFNLRVPHVIGEAVRVKVIDPNGTPGTIPLNDLQNAIKKNYRLASPVDQLKLPFGPAS